MAISKNKRAARRRHTTNNSGLMATAMRKLETRPGARYEDVLTSEEYGEALLMIRAAVVFVREHMAKQRYKGKRLCPPSRFSWRGRTWPLRYGVFLGQVFIANHDGKPLIGSGYDAI